MQHEPRRSMAFGDRTLTDDQLESLRKHVRVNHGEDGNLPLSDTKRRMSMPIVTGGACEHVELQQVEVSTKYGIWITWVCVGCGQARGEGPQCAHIHMQWVLDGTLLVCSNCGIDGT